MEAELIAASSACDNLKALWFFSSHGYPSLLESLPFLFRLGQTNY